MAWVKASGLLRLADGIAAARADKTEFEVVLGIDERGATREGLRLARTLFNRVYVYQDPRNRTFHPKIYAVEAADSKLLIVGSGNLTKGGLYTNYEGFLSAEFDKTDGADPAVLAEAREYFERLRDSKEASRLLDDATLDELIKNPKYGVGPERQKKSGVKATSSTGIFKAPTGSVHPAPPLPPKGTWSDAEIDAEDDEADDDSGLEPLPGMDASSPEAGVQAPAAMAEPKPPAPPAGPIVPASAPPAAGATAPVPGTAAPAGAPAPTTVSFWKRMSNYDVSISSSPGQIIIPIQFRPFFEPLALEKDESATGGPRQFGREFPVDFRDGGYLKSPDSRAIVYEPAATHPRPNKELRFTFRDREILLRLKAGDILEFRKDSTGAIRVRRLDPGARVGRFGV